MSGRVRAVAAALCLVLSALLIPLSLAGWWVRTTLTETDDYVATVAPLASDPAVQDAAARALADRVGARLEEAALLDRAVDRLSERRIPPELIAALRLLAEPARAEVRERVEDAASRLVGSEAFADSWASANRTAHAELVAVLEGESDLVAEGPDATVNIRLATLVNALQTILADAGVPGADRLGSVDASFPVAATDQLDRLQVGYRLLRGGTLLLVLLCVALGAAGVALARRRTTALIRLALGGVLAVLLTQVGLSAVSDQLLTGIAGGPNAAAAEAILGQVTDPLRALLRAGALGLVVVAAVTALTGPSPRATRLRSVVGTTARSAVDAVSQRREAGWVGIAVAAVAAGLALLLPDPGPGALLALVAVACLGALTARRAPWGR